MMDSLVLALTVGIIIMIIAILLTFLTMLLLVVVVKILTHTTHPLLPVPPEQSSITSKGPPYHNDNLEVIITAATSLYLEQEKEIYGFKSTDTVLKISPLSTWETLGRHNHFIRRYKR